MAKLSTKEERDLYKTTLLKISQNARSTYAARLARRALDEASRERVSGPEKS
jgi:hypothetical protein